MVTELIGRSIVEKINNPWLRALYVKISDQEVVHDWTYNKIIDMVLSGGDRAAMDSFIETSVALQRKIACADKWKTCGSMEELLIRLMCTEMILFQGAFILIELTRLRKLDLPSIQGSNDYIR